MKLKVRHMRISTGGVLVATLDEDDAHSMDLHLGDRVRISKGSKTCTAMVDIADRLRSIPKGTIGVFEELKHELHTKTGESVHVSLAKKPESIQYIRSKLFGKKLSEDQLNCIITDIVKHRLSDIELAYFVSACFTNGLTLHETIALTKAVVENGSRVDFKRSMILDKHCIGGVAGNRTTMIVVPIIAAAGITIPKTSSRSITSPAGTADTVEVLTNVSLPLEKMSSVLKKTNGCLLWGGALDLASADDMLIKVRHSISLDPEGMLLASVLAKKIVVNSTHVLIDIPIGRDSKISHKKQAKQLKIKFEEIGKYFDIKIKVIITDGSQPIGNGIGPCLEARDVLWLLEDDSRAPQDLYHKSIEMAGILLEMAGKAKVGNGKTKAEQILKSGKAHKKMLDIIRAQGGKVFHANNIPIGKYHHTIKSEKKGFVSHINNKTITKIARIAGAPLDKQAGIYLYKHVKSLVEKGGDLYTIYAESKQKLNYAKGVIKDLGCGFEIRSLK